MKIGILMALAAILALGACGDGDRVEADNMTLDNMAMDSSSGAPMDNMATADAGVPANGQEYAEMAGGSDMYEIESARLAIDKSQNAKVKELAEMILKDHEKSTADLKKTAGEASPPITLAPAMNPEQQANIEALRSADAATFDQTYLEQQVAAHQKALAMVQGYAEAGDVASLKQHAANVAGPIQQHLQQAQALAGKSPQ